MKVRATAVAEGRANAIGTVELECTPHGLAVAYLGVGAFQEDYAPGALTIGTRITVPWSKVEAARVEGDQMYLGIDPELTPHSRMVLTHFTAGDHAHHREVFKQRLVVWIGAGGGAIVVSMIAALTLPRVAPSTGAGAALALGGLAALAIICVGLVADRQLGRSGLEGDAAREAFALELSRSLPSLVRLPHRPAAPERPFTWPSFEGWIPRTTAAVVITLTASLLGAVLTARWLLSPAHESRSPLVASTAEPERPAPVEPKNVAPPPAPLAPPPSAETERPSSPSTTLEGRCSCTRASSLLWTAPIPKLGVLVLERKLVSGPVRKRLELEIAAINNGDRDLREIAMSMTFFEQDPPPSNKRYPVANRAVYFEGPLTPGQAIKWSVEARGSAVEVDRPLHGDIGPAGEGAAPANLIAELLAANHRPVRLHGAMLLGYLGDPRAKEAALKLKEGMRDDEQPYLDRLVRALSEVSTCHLRVTGDGNERTVEACVFNSGREPRDKLALRVRALDGTPNPGEPTEKPPSVVAEATFALGTELPPQAGVTARAKLDVSKASAAPVSFEAFADREDLLP
ncbi:MAG: hypothetical protein HYZ29_24355 [Myxococcales bacterium]|nr:hypothetical protein [Myxococcales bacterium]